MNSAREDTSKTSVPNTFSDAFLNFVRSTKTGFFSASFCREAFGH